MAGSEIPLLENIYIKPGMLTLSRENQTGIRKTEKTVKPALL